MHEPHTVGGMGGLGDLLGHLQLLLERQRRAQRLEGPPGHVLHGDEGPAVLHARFVDRADVLVVDAGLGTGLAQQSFGERRVVAAQQLEGHVTVEGGIVGLEDGAHAARAQDLQVAVAAEMRAGVGGCGRQGGVHARRLVGERIRVSFGPHDSRW